MFPRKQLSGHLKWKRKKQIEIDVESQKGALHIFFGKDSTISFRLTLRV